MGRRARGGRTVRKRRREACARNRSADESQVHWRKRSTLRPASQVAAVIVAAGERINSTAGWPCTSNSPMPTTAGIFVPAENSPTMDPELARTGGDGHIRAHRRQHVLPSQKKSLQCGEYMGQNSVRPESSCHSRRPKSDDHHRTYSRICAVPTAAGGRTECSEWGKRGSAAPPRSPGLGGQRGRQGGASRRWVSLGPARGTRATL